MQNISRYAYYANAACLPGEGQILRHDGAMSARRAPGPGRKPRGGILRTRTTVRLIPEDKTRFEQLADQLGLSLTDTLAYYAAIGAGLEIPVDIQKLLEEHQLKQQQQLEIQPTLVA